MGETNNGPFTDGAAFEEAVSNRRALPPIHAWNPPFHGNFDMAIDAGGQWSYRGTPIRRHRMVKLFSTILRREDDDGYYLVTPVEKVGVIVEDVPFQAVELSVDGTGEKMRLTFRTNVDDVVEAGPANPIRFAEDPDTGGLVPYVLVRDRLEARLVRSLVFDLVDLAVERAFDGGARLGVWSGGAFFALPDVEGTESG